jgi:hypothetical protein
MPSVITKDGLASALARLNSGVYRVKGEQDYRATNETKENNARRNLALYHKKCKAGTWDKERARRWGKKYNDSVPKSARRDLERWELEFLLDNIQRPARLIAFALGRGLRSIEEKRRSIQLGGSTKYAARKRRERANDRGPKGQPDTKPARASRYPGKSTRLLLQVLESRREGAK